MFHDANCGYGELKKINIVVGKKFILCWLIVCLPFFFIDPVRSEAPAAVEVNTSKKAIEWIVKPKVISIAKGLSEPVRDSLEESGPPKRIETPLSSKAWKNLAASKSQTNSVSLGFLEKLFEVKIEASVISAVNVHRITPLTINPLHEKNIFIHLHGGGYLFGAGAAGASEGAVIASVVGMRVVSVDYSLLPEHPYPKALNEVIAVYDALTRDFSPSQIAMGGSSAGAHLALSTCHKLRVLGSPLPGGLFLGTPLADLTLSGDTVTTNEGIDNVIGTFTGFHSELQQLYANGHDLTDPLISPLFGDFSDFPASFLVSGTRDILLSDTVRVHQRLRRANVTADLIVLEGLPHGAYLRSPNTPEYQSVFRELSNFLDEHLGFKL